MAGTSRKIVIIGGGIAGEQRPLAILAAASAASW
jgi:hypothetical protein